MYEFPPAIVALIHRQLAQYGRMGADTVYRIPELNAALTPGLTRTATPLRFNKAGYILAMYGTTDVATAPANARTAIQLEFGSTEWLCTDGQGGAFMSFRSMFGDTQNWFPLLREVEPGDNWTVTYRNRNAFDVIPEVEFSFVTHKQLAAFLERVMKDGG